MMDHIYKQIVSFQHRCNDYIDDSSLPRARSLQKAVQKLEDEAQTGKSPISLEGRIKEIINILEEVVNDNAMSHGHAEELIDQCEHLRNQLRKM
jgi:uncharacterized coiled-coil DUF342 family protein